MVSLNFIVLVVNKFLSSLQSIVLRERKATRYALLVLVLGVVVTRGLSVQETR